MRDQRAQCNHGGAKQIGTSHHAIESGEDEIGLRNVAVLLGMRSNELNKQ